MKTALVLLCAGWLIGCSSSTPRFTASRPESAPVPSPDTTGRHVIPPPPHTSPAQDETTSPSPFPATAARIEDNPALDRHRILSAVMLMMGTPYEMRGEDTTGFDCSGFTARIYRDAMAIRIPRSTKEQYEFGTSVDRDDLRFGDLVFFATSGRTPSHVGIYVGDGLFAHASVSIGVTISPLASSYYDRRYVGARRVTQ